MSELITARNLGFRVGRTTLVENVSLGVEAGRLTVIVGPNGAGKSTLVRLLSGELVPSAGHVAYRGEPVAAIPPWRLACLRAVLPQASRLAFPFMAGEVARIGLDGIGRGLRAGDLARILANALACADVTHLADRTYQSLSGGEQQRTQFARVLAQMEAGRSVADAQVLLLDEPIASLDLKHQLALLEAASTLVRRGVAVVAVLHDLNLASAFADEIVVMSEGRIVARGAPAAVLDDALVSEVFGVALRVGMVPEGGRPFILPSRGAWPDGNTGASSS